MTYAYQPPSPAEEKKALADALAHPQTLDEMLILGELFDEYYDLRKEHARIELGPLRRYIEAAANETGISQLEMAVLLEDLSGAGLRVCVPDCSADDPHPVTLRALRRQILLDDMAAKGHKVAMLRSICDKLCCAKDEGAAL